jgi:hypothetical protein
MEFQIFTCPSSSCQSTFYTLDELANHRLETHERPLDEDASRLRLAGEVDVVGRARTTPWSADLTHWHQARIAGRALENENGAAKHANP